MIDYTQAIMIIIAIFVMNIPLYYKVGKLDAKMDACDEKLDKINGVVK